ncbi:SDR family oxidoreductase [Fluviibacterium sp. DFM31]|uniref:SDR family oxidoreductase n=1 Tax=Meridianimarinicoccus marinus TaxID=3231483 RepID=A0ABV3L717_9RHOB
MDHVSGKTVLITGASRGIGAAAAREFARAGANVVLLARSREPIADLAGEIGETALAVPCDVSRYWEVSAAVDAAEATYGPVEVLVNNAGVIEPIARLVESDPEDWAKVQEINTLGVYHGMRAVLPGMIGRGRGTILTISSGAASRPMEGWSHYCASKAAVKMLTEQVHLEAGEAGVRAIGLSPGTVATEMQSQIKASGVNRVSQLDWSEHIPADWPAKALVWLAGPAADDLVGTEVSLRDEALRRRMGLDA